jgi:multiple sugar transport system substrate-binding protein
VAAAGGLAGVLATGRAPAYAQTTTVHWLRWNDFIPASDKLLRETILPEAEKALGIKINFETVNGNDLQPRITAAIHSGVGPDLIMLFNNHPHLYKSSLADLSDVAEAVGSKQEGYYDVSKANSFADGRWISMPMNIIGVMHAYRKSWFEEIGLSKFPETFDALRDAGKKLKAKGRPLGQSLGHSFGDPPVFSYPFLWSFGGAEVDKEGKKVVINSKETLESVKYMTALWKDAYDEGGLAWDDSNNNRAFLSGSCSATLNGASIYVESLRRPQSYQTERGTPMKDDILHAPLPSGPGGQFSYHVPFTNMLMRYSRNQDAAKRFLAWIGSKEIFERWFVSQKGFSVGPTKTWEAHALWSEDPVMLPFRTAAQTGRFAGYAGPSSRKAAETLTKYILTDMYAKAVQGMAPEQAVREAHDELVKIYAAA